MDNNFNRNLVRDFRRYNRSWMPSEEGRLTKVKERLHSRWYRGQIDKLIEDLHHDPIVYLRALQAVSSLESLGGQSVSSLHPDELFRFCGFSQLAQIVTSIQEAPDEERGNTELHELARTEMAIAANLSSEFAASLSLSSEIAYSASLLRAFGTTLVAWNNPELYMAAASVSAGPDQLDRFLTRELGYSARLIGALFSAEWSLCPEVQLFLGNRSDDIELLPDRKRQITQLCSTLREIISASEALASFSNSLYPTRTSERWQQLSGSLKRLIGNDAISIVQRALEDEFSDALEQILHFDSKRVIAPAPQQTPPAPKATPRYIRQEKDEHLRALIRTFSNLVEDKNSRNAALRQLIDVICPQYGFEGGSVYLFEPENMRLVRRLSFGKLEDFDRPSFPVLVNASQSHIVQAAYNCSITLFECSDEPSCRVNTGVASVLGQSRRSGVLLLRVEPKRLQHPDYDSRKAFRTVLELFGLALDLY